MSCRGCKFPSERELIDSGEVGRKLRGGGEGKREMGEKHMVVEGRDDEGGLVGILNRMRMKFMFVI